MIHLEIHPSVFFSRYELIASTAKFKTENKKSKQCRFCGSTSNTFTQKTHLLPELLGTNEVYTYDECDKCNNLFSGFESHLANFVRPYLTLIGVKGKEKVPSFQSRSFGVNKTNRTILKHTSENRKELILDDLEDYALDDHTKTLRLTFKKPPFVPIKVYKALLKVALSVLPIEFHEQNIKLFQWICGQIESLNFFKDAYVVTLNKQKFAEPMASLYRAKVIQQDANLILEYSFVLCFANQVIQIFLPFSKTFESLITADTNLELTLFPGFALGKTIPDKLEFKHYDLSKETSVTEDLTITLSYQQMESL